MNNSKFFSLNVRDFLKGLLVATGTAFGTGLIAVLQNGTIPQSGDFRTMGISAAAAGVAYLVKNLFTNSNGEVAKKE